MTAPLRRAGIVVRHRGGPLVMLALLLTGWCGARVMWWDNPFAGATLAKAQAQAPVLTEVVPPAVPVLLPVATLPVFVPESPVRLLWAPAARALDGGRASDAGRLAQAGPATAPDSARGLPAPGPAPGRDPVPVPPPFMAAPLAPPLAAPRTSTAGRTSPAGRWSLDAWAFWRQGSAATPVSQGRVPIYGASQTGAVLQYRLAPSSRHDPRLYARAYRALVRRGESEAALGASLRPLGRVPLRLAGEVRYTDAAFFTDVRPAAYAVTEIAPLRLPLGAVLEVYGQAGWVGGRGATPFADGQASATRELPFVARLTDDRLRLNLGAGAWGGAQDDAQRVDVGPTLRLDTRIGQVPARVSVDWRLRVAGDASPGSGVAATVSAGF
jgi:hypothetical protein